MTFFSRTRWALAAALSACLLSACGGGGGGSTTGSSANTVGANNATTSTTALAANAVAVTVGPSLAGNTFRNIPTISVTVCATGTANCQTIDNILVDTGSVGLRLISSAVSVTLPTTAAPSGATLAECVNFASGYGWGTVRTADVTIGGKSASAMRLHLMHDSSIPSAPSSCVNALTGYEVDTVARFGANGVLGIGQLPQDCGTGCASSTSNHVYYGCALGVCSDITLPVAQQLPHPVTQFAADNNGTVLQLPAIASGGQSSATGLLIFGIGTASNNTLGSATILKTNGLTFNGQYNGSAITSFLDSGSNGIYFPSNITQCSQSGFSTFYCPSASMTQSATLTGSDNATSAAISFVVDNTVTTFQANNGGNNALPGLAGYPSGMSDLDLGLPFFYGRSVFTAISGVSTPGGAGPFVAF
ncbi:hypothetical protein WM40_07435 [Robbsia andropogonis]|uniref:Lipoprotein n=1 Tax=Robbsia andropogonis TaxID=28092 RepID=A0A0F5K334_9BURK|nr:DUF3443 family protein [Robbsia andropogonis]KKB64284.1 hypothetical protein WM40_07435 [Robbsia andropogonis]MCP1119606.1 DUF3443 domain-containing protein [Robbsia andropogonis]MCP1129589.1 DUF3443 domain-containing protein [Robbsia andropogonis]